MSFADGLYYDRSQTTAEREMSDESYIEEPTEGAPIKAWVRGVPVEEAAWRQLRNVAALPIIHGHVAAMPAWIGALDTLNAPAEKPTPTGPKLVLRHDRASQLMHSVPFFTPPGHETRVRVRRAVRPLRYAPIA